MLEREPQLITGELESAAWLSPSCLLLAGSLGGGSLEEARASIALAGQDRRPVETGGFWLQAPGETGGSGSTRLLAVILPPGMSERGRNFTVLIEGGTGTLELSERDLGRVSTDIPGLVRDQFAPLDASVRSSLLEFLTLTLGQVPRPEQFDLSERLFSARQALRERLPAISVSQSRRRGLHVDRVMAVDDRSFFIEGWLLYEDIELKRFTAISPEGGRAELLHRLARVARPDVSQFFELGAHRIREKVGFLCFFELAAPSLHPDGWILELEDARGERSELAAPTVLSDTIDVREAILEDPQVEKLLDDSLMQQHVYPAISRIQQRLDTEARIESVVQHGTAPEAPDISIVIPLYRHIEHVESQLAEFADDPEIARADLIYVLDSPEDAYALRKYAAELYPIYRVPFRVATLATNVGFAGACNTGASLARGRMLLLLNSDVLPAHNGWLGRMRDFYDATPNIGALGPKMLYEDDSIQHAGMYFMRYPDPGLRIWVDATYYKGMHSSLPAANIARPVPAVSGACLMIERELFEDLGGLQQIYVRGDYEDSHLCLELLDRGRENWYLPDASLYHLEAQSYTSALRGPSNRFNGWVYALLWGERIESMMNGVESTPAPRSANGR
jgi:GT2 family glycosyltransferase